MKIIGLTGGIASGKSTVSRMLVGRGWPVIDADQVAREVVAKGSPGLAEVVGSFGSQILDPEGNLNREALGAVVFSDPEARARLNAIVHPRVQAATTEKLGQLAKSGAALAFMDIPLLFEVRNPADFDRIIVIYVDRETQLRRLMERNDMTREAALARIDSQLSLDEKAKRASHVIDNRGSVEETKRQLEVILGGLTK